MTDRGREEAERIVTHVYPSCTVNREKKLVEAISAALSHARKAALEEKAQIWEEAIDIFQMAQGDEKYVLDTFRSRAAAIRTLSQQEDGK